MSFETRNIFSEIPVSLPEEVVEVIANKGSVRIERIISMGHRSPDDFWYDQKEDEFVMLLSGSATLLFEKDAESKKVLPGDYLFIPAHTKHRVESTDSSEESVWIAIHF
jgi:cupin 2 domain-containing protein